VAVLGFLQLRDPDGKVPFALFRPDRLLTGADFDLESVRRAKDGSFWFGEEFGPFLLHTDATGEVLEAPVPLPGVQSPQNPFLPDPDAWTLPAPAAGSRAWPEASTASGCTRCWRARSATTPTRGGGSSTSSTSTPAPTPGGPGSTTSTPAFPTP
jgi:hypothetical protein